MQHEYYKPGLFLEAGVGNNAFSMDKKPERKALAITPLREGNLRELKVGQHIAFQDYDGDNWLECTGLETAILSQEYAIPVYVFDNHNHVFYAWYEALHNGCISQGSSLLHMDAHFDDTRALHTDFDQEDLAAVWRYTNEVLQIASYIQPALERGLFSQCINAVESRHFDPDAWPTVSGDVVMNIDLDVFCDEMSHVTRQQKLAVLQHYLPQTKLITIASSPYFIDQQQAIHECHELVSALFG